MRIIIVTFFVISMVGCSSGKKSSSEIPKPALAVYSGGHHWDIKMVLYKDSTFLYQVRTDFIGSGSKRKGTYTKTDTSLTLYSKKIKPVTYRIHGKELLMFTEQQEKGEDGLFMIDYYTLTLQER